MAEQQDNYGPDYRASMAGARLQWDKLSPTMQNEMLDAELHSGFARRIVDGHMATCDALWVRGLAEDKDRTTWLTPMGLLVREAGLAARAEAAR